VDEKERRVEMVQGYLETARNSREDAEQHLKAWRFSDSVRASQTCIELSVKSMYILLNVKFTPNHKLVETEYGQLVNKIPEDLSYLNFPRLLLFANFWAEFYTKAKYGLEILQVPPTKLFEKQEAELAMKHAQECYYAADQLRTRVVFYTD
jgi:HEPN domain-containing protein